MGGSGHDVRVVIADTNINDRRELQDQILRFGYLVVASTDDGRAVAQIIFQRQPDVSIVNVHLPGRSGLEVCRVVTEQLVSAVILVADDLDWDIVEKARDAGAHALLIKPLQDQALLPAIETAISCFKKYKDIAEENRRLREELETRRLLERAKQVLIRQRGWTEEDAYRYLRAQSMRQCVPMRRLAKAVLEGKFVER